MRYFFLFFFTSICFAQEIQNVDFKTLTADIEIDQFEKPGSDDEVRNSCFSTIQTYECARNVRYLDGFNIQYPA